LRCRASKPKVIVVDRFRSLCISAYLRYADTLGWPLTGSVWASLTAMFARFWTTRLTCTRRTCTPTRLTTTKSTRTPHPRGCLRPASSHGRRPKPKIGGWHVR
jgi:hypothetical protein